MPSFSYTGFKKQTCNEVEGNYWLISTLTLQIQPNNTYFIENLNYSTNNPIFLFRLITENQASVT